MGFNADAFLAAHRPWTLTIGGRTYTARAVSVAEVLAFKAATEGADATSGERAVRRLLRRMFPYRLHYRWRGDPVALLIASGPAAVREALADFFGHLAGTTPSPTTTPPSPPSSGPTPPPTTVEGAPV